MRPQKTIRSVQFQTVSNSSDGFRFEEVLKGMANICGYVIIFRALAAVIEEILPITQGTNINALIKGLLELTLGFTSLQNIGSVKLVYCFASLFLSFGGCCIWMQTRTIYRSASLTGKYYLTGKMLHAVIAVLLTYCTVCFFPNLLQSELEAANISNHAGLLPSTALVSGLVLLFAAIWFINLRNKAGKEINNVV